MLISYSSTTTTLERPGNHFLARLSHENTITSLSERRPSIEQQPDEEECPPTIIAQDRVDEAAMESFPASDPPSFAAAHA